MNALELLVTKGRLRLVEQGERAYLRVEVYTADPLELDALGNCYGGRATKHSPYVWRWWAQRDEHLRVIARALFLAGKAPAVTLLAYLDLREATARWRFLRELFERVAAKSITLAQLNRGSVTT